MKEKEIYIQADVEIVIFEAKGIITLQESEAGGGNDGTLDP